MIVKVSCPYCGYENLVEVKCDSPENQVILCDCDKGGCDRHFAIFPSVNASITIKTKMIGNRGTIRV